MRRFAPWGFLLIAAAVLTGCATAPAPTVSVVNLSFGQATAFETGAIFTLRLQNTSPEPQRFKGGVHRVALDDVEVGTGLSSEPFTVPALGETTQEVTVHFSNLLLATRLKGMINAQSVSYRLDSTLHPASGFGSRHIVKEGRIRLDDFAPAAR